MDSPLCVDLDGTLIKSNTSHEAFLLLIKKNPFYFLMCLFWLLYKGKTFLKQKINEKVELNPALLPYTESLLNYLKEEKDKGRYIVLVTNANKKIATKIADHVNIFSEVITHANNVNLKIEKAQLLNKKYGEKNYVYAGNHKEDLLVWQSAKAAIIVNAKGRIVHQAKKLSPIENIFVKNKITYKHFFNLLRIHQYVKNLLIFVPIIAAHSIFNISVMLHLCVAFFIFCLLASSAYLLNDLLDIHTDRQHRYKQYRALAAGNISIRMGFIIFPILFIMGIGLGFLLPTNFLITILIYYLTTILYSFYFKKIVLIDVFTLACLYTLRIIAGIAALSLIYSPWLLSFSMFFFLNLAFVKRYMELKYLAKTPHMLTTGKNYILADTLQLKLFGVISGYLSVLVFALYINSVQVSQLYSSPYWLWIICPILLYWISRVWLLANRKLLHDDPIIFALKDKVSWLMALVCGCLIALASL